MPAPLLLLLASARALTSPLPAPTDRAAQERATACVFYYRLQIPSVPGGSAGCEADGYGLSFMRAHGAEIAAIERAHQAALDAQLARAHAVAAALRDRDALKGPCTAMVLDGGPGPDGGAELCRLAGLSHDVITRIARHDAFVLAQQRAQDHRRWAVRGAVGGGALLILALAASLLRRRRG